MDIKKRDFLMAGLMGLAAAAGLVGAADRSGADRGAQSTGSTAAGGAAPGSAGQQQRSAIVG